MRICSRNAAGGAGLVTPRLTEADREIFRRITRQRPAHRRRPPRRVAEPLNIVRHPRPLLDQAAQLAARYGGTGLLTAETLAAGMAHGELYFGLAVNVGRLLERAAGEIGIAIHLA